MAFGDVLRGLGSVLNPQVAQGIEREDLMRMEQQKALQMLAIQHQLQQQSPQYQMQMEQLQNERSFRQAVAGAGGDETKIAQAAMQFGKPEIAANLVKAKEDRAARVEQSQQANELKKLVAEQTHQARMQSITDAKERAAEVSRHNRVMEGLSAQNAQANQLLKTMMFDLQKTKVDLMQDQGTQKQVQQLGKAIEGAKLNEQNAVLGNVESLIQKNPKILEFATGPGSALPDFAVPTDIALGRQAIQKLFNIELKNRSGAAVTAPEFERLKDEYAKGAFKTPAQLKGAIEQARGLLTKHYQSVAAGYGPEALKAYNDNLAGIGGMPVIEIPGASATTPQKPSKVVDFGSLK